jgi:hypothetical protein
VKPCITLCLFLITEGITSTIPLRSGLPPSLRLRRDESAFAEASARRVRRRPDLPATYRPARNRVGTGAVQGAAWGPEPSPPAPLPSDGRGVFFLCIVPRVPLCASVVFVK